MNRSELEKLIDEVLDNDCSEADFLRLEAELHVDPAARRIYYQRMKLDTALSLAAEELVEEKIISRPNFFARKLPLLAGIAAALMVMVGWQLGRIGKQAPEVAAAKEPRASGFGVLAEESNAVWGSEEIDRGELLPQGALHLKQGIAQLELFSGVTVILEGDSKFELHSAMEMTVRSGKMRAVVPPPARGFRVKTSTGDVVDLGTEFALDVSDDHADLHVLDGEVEWHPSSHPARRLLDGDSIRWQSDGEMNELPSAGDQFAGLDEIQKSQSQKYTAWLTDIEEVKKDPRLVAYYPMIQNRSWDRILQDESGSGRDGAIVRATRSTDRWEKANQALDFGATGSRVRVDIPGEYSALTFYCWVKISSLDRWYNSLFLTDGHDLHEPHWQIMDDGRIFFSVKAQDGVKGKPDKKNIYSPPIWTPQLSGQWFQIAVTYDSSSKKVTHYVNGKPVASEVLPDEFVVDKVRIGPASIGNWSEPFYRKDPHFTVRNLNGAIDEFAIFSEALPAAEIARLYKKGKP